MSFITIYFFFLLIAARTIPSNCVRDPGRIVFSFFIYILQSFVYLFREVWILFKRRVGFSRARRSCSRNKVGDRLGRKFFFCTHTQIQSNKLRMETYPKWKRREVLFFEKKKLDRRFGICMEGKKNNV